MLLNSTNRRLKILILSHKFYPDIGGIEVNSKIFAEAFCQAGHEVRLLTWTKEKGDSQFPFVIIRNPNPFTILHNHLWAEVVLENNPTLKLSWPAMVLKKAHVTALCTWINRVDGTIGWQDKLKRWWLKRCSAVIAVSDAVRTKCYPKAIVISNPYNENLFRILPDVKKDRDFVFLGRLVSDKGVDVALRALSIVWADGKELAPNVAFTIIGDGPEKKLLESLVHQLDIENKVSFVGSMEGEELVRCLNRHKFIIVPSVWEEPFGNVALEGMASGCVPIVSNGGGLPTAIGNAGLIFPSGDVDALVGTIEKVTADISFQLQLRANAKEHLELHKPKVIAEKYLDVMKKAI